MPEDVTFDVTGHDPYRDQPPTLPSTVERRLWASLRGAASEGAPSSLGLVAAPGVCGLPALPLASPGQQGSRLVVQLRSGRHHSASGGTLWTPGLGVGGGTGSPPGIGDPQRPFPISIRLQ